MTGSESHFKGDIIVLVDVLTFSQTETIAMAFRTNPNTKIIGSDTAGADGSAVSFIMPGGTIAFFTSWGIYYPDGSETQGIGIVPDIVVKPTLEGIKAGKDEVLLNAIELLK